MAPSIRCTLVVLAAVWLLWPGGDARAVAAVDPPRPLSPLVERLLMGGLLRAPDAPAIVPEYQADKLPDELEKEFVRRKLKRETRSGNYLGPKVSAKTLDEDLVPVWIEGNYQKDLRGKLVFLRRTIRDKLLIADEAMFKKKNMHIAVNYGFRSNKVQSELYQKLVGKGKVALPGLSFHESGMAMDIQNWRDAQKFLIEAGFVGGCYGIEEDFVHYSIGEISKASNVEAFKRCTLKEIPENIVKGLKKVGGVAKGVGGAAKGMFKRNKN